MVHNFYTILYTSTIANMISPIFKIKQFLKPSQITFITIVVLSRLDIVHRYHQLQDIMFIIKKCCGTTFSGVGPDYDKKNCE